MNSIPLILNLCVFATIIVLDIANGSPVAYVANPTRIANPFGKRDTLPPINKERIPDIANGSPALPPMILPQMALQQKALQQMALQQWALQQLALRLSGEIPDEYFKQLTPEQFRAVAMRVKHAQFYKIAKSAGSEMTELKPLFLPLMLLHLQLKGVDVSEVKLTVEQNKLLDMTWDFFDQERLEKLHWGMEQFFIPFRISPTWWNKEHFVKENVLALLDITALDSWADKWGEEWSELKPEQKKALWYIARKEYPDWWASQQLP